MKKITTLICLLFSLAIFNGCSSDSDPDYVIPASKADAAQEEDNLTEVATPDGDTAEVNLDTLRAGLSFYYGNLHGHSNYSDGQGSADEALTWARDEAGYDFYAMTDHAIQIMGFEWDIMGDKTPEYSVNGEFIALRGFEWSSPIHGHINIYDTDDYRNNALLPSLTGIYNWIDERGALAQFNHPGREARTFNPLLSGQDFALNKALIDNFFAMETGNKGDGNNDGEYLAYYPIALDQGWRIAPTSNQDNHSLTTNSHRTVIIAEELTKEGLFDAMGERRIISSDDPNIQVIFKHGENWMGSEIELSDAIITFDVYVKDDEPITKLQLVSNGGAIVAEEVLSETPSEVYWNAEVELPEGESYFYLQVDQLNTLDGEDAVQIAVTAPIWISNN